MKPGGHGDHWHSIYSDRPRDEFVAAIRRIVDGAKPHTTTRDRVSAFCSPGDLVRTCVLVKRNSVVTAYPEVLGGPVWPVKLREVIPWQNGVEGQIVGVCMGAAVSFFDTRFFANRARYRPGEVYDFRVGALAYAVRPADEMEAETEQGVKVSLKGAHAYLPMAGHTSGGDIDDYWFYSSLEGDPVETTLDGASLRGYPLILALPNEFEMSVTLFVAEHTRGAGMDGVQPGTDLDGALWLQGHLEDQSRK